MLPMCTWSEIVITMGRALTTIIAGGFLARVGCQGDDERHGLQNRKVKYLYCNLTLMT